MEDDVAHSEFQQLIHPRHKSRPIDTWTQITKKTKMQFFISLLLVMVAGTSAFAPRAFARTQGSIVRRLLTLEHLWCVPSSLWLADTTIKNNDLVILIFHAP